MKHPHQATIASSPAVRGGSAAQPFPAKRALKSLRIHESSPRDHPIAEPMKSNADRGSSSSIASAEADVVMQRQLAAIAGGDRRTFEALYLQMYPSLSRFVARHCGRRELIEEIINETFWVVWRKAASFRGDSRSSTWIIGIAYRCMLKLLREQPPVTSGSSIEELHESASDEEYDSEQRELRDWLGRGMALLPADQRMTLQLAYYLGQSCEEIAVVMDCAVGTVKARLFHARLRLRNSLPGLGGETGASTLARSPQS